MIVSVGAPDNKPFIVGVSKSEISAPRMCLAAVGRSGTLGRGIKEQLFIVFDAHRPASHSRLLHRGPDRLRAERPSRNDGASVRPLRLADMTALAEKLAAGWDFLRVDLYCPNDKEIIVGELTMTPAAGRHRFYPDRTYDDIMGQKWANGRVTE
jgi:hypothetical protein